MIIQVVERHLVIFCLFTSLNSTLVRSRNRWFYWSPGTRNSFSSSLPTQNAKSDVSRGRIFFELIFGLLTNAKCYLREVEKAMFQGLALSSQLILDLSTSPKWDLDEVEKANFQSLEWHSQLNFGLWTSWKCNLMKTKMRWFKWSPIIGNSFSSLELPKMRLGWSRKSDISRGRMSLWTHIRPLHLLKMILGWVRKSDVSRTRLAFSTTSWPLD